MPKHKPPGGFIGELGKPIEPIPEYRFPDGVDTDSIEADAFKVWHQWNSEQHVARERERKFPALFAHYGLEDRQWKKLAEKLAAETVPGFQVRTERRGRAVEWDDLCLFLLHRAHSELVANGKTSAEACEAIARSSPWWATSVDSRSAAGQSVRARSLANLLPRAADSRFVIVEKLLGSKATRAAFEREVKRLATREEKQREALRTARLRRAGLATHK